MKIENSKSANQNDNFKTRQSAFAQNNPDEHFQTDNNQIPFGEFANIFESVVNRDKEKESDNENSTQNGKLEDTEKEDLLKDHQRVSEKKKNNDPETGGNAETNAGLAAWRMNSNQTPVANLENINARAILHIADIEKIVSSIRTQLIDNNIPQVVIQLKNSVLEGLQIKLSTDLNGKIVAEFVAKSEKAKLQVEAKTKELADILHNRGIHLSTIKTSLADSSQNNQNKRENQPTELPIINAKTKEITPPAEMNETGQVSSSNSYRV